MAGPETSLTRQNSRLQGLSKSLTGAASARRQHAVEKTLTIAYIDLDNFKKVNDEQGHEEGDRVLKEVSLTVLAQIRKSDIFSRIGGDEFTLLLPETDSNEAYGLIERIHNEMTILVKANNWPITFSIGIVSFVSTPNSVKEMIDVADTLMYSVKKTSKNRIVVQEIK